MIEEMRLKPGDTFIAYVDDSTSCVGVATDARKPGRTNCLILGWFTNRGAPPNTYVFGCQKMHRFPSYEMLKDDTILPYDFEEEIRLCKIRNESWWKSQNPGSTRNLVAKHFYPRRAEVLSIIHAARHILQGGTIDDFDTWSFFAKEDFLSLWAVLHHHFPEEAQRPPNEWDSPRSNTYYIVRVDSNGNPSITTGFRSTRTKSA